MPNVLTLSRRAFQRRLQRRVGRHYYVELGQPFDKSKGTRISVVTGEGLQLHESFDLGIASSRALNMEGPVRQVRREVRLIHEARAYMRCTALQSVEEAIERIANQRLFGS